MAEMSKAYTPEFMGDPNPREKILKLARKITDCVDHKILGVTVNDPEYWGLACVVTDEMADVALKMKVRHHYTFEDLLAKNPELGKEKLQKLLDDMSRIGILEYDYGDNYDHNGPIKGAKKIRRYTLPMFVPGSAEFTNMIKKQLDDHPELAMFFERMTYLPLTMVTPMVPPGGAGIGMHVIPVEKAIEMENGTMDIEHISYWLKKYEGHLGVGICSCRYGRAKLGEGCGDSCEEWCIGIGDMADYCRETGKGRDITYDEAMQILKTPKRTVSYIRSRISTAKTRFSQSATATSISATLCVRRNFSTRLICPEARTSQGLKKTNAWRAASAWNTAPPER